MCSKDIENFILKVKQDYHRHLEVGSDRARGSPQNDGKNPISGGGLEEWKKENAKIVNNGMILADEGVTRQYDASERSYRADTFESEYSAREAEQQQQHQQQITPRAPPSMFRAINNRQHHPEDPVSVSSSLRHAAASSHGTPPRRVPSGGTFVAPGGQGGRGGSEAATPIPRDGNEMDVIEQLDEWESTRIADCLAKVGGDIQGFSYGDVPKQTQVFDGLPLLG